MELRNLRAFVEVVRQGGFSKAAKVVFATQSTVSKAVKQLEDELGTPLLDRAARANALTSAGEVVYRRAIRMLTERDALIGELDEVRGLRRGLLRLGLPPVGATALFAPLFARYRRRYPQVEIRLVEQGSARLEEILRAGEIEIAGALLPVSGDFEWQEVRREPLVALLPSTHALARAGSVTMANLREMPFLLFEEGFALNRIVLDACRRRGFAPEVAGRSAHVEFLAGLVAAGVGVAFFPRMIARQHASSGVSAVPLDEARTDWHLVLAWRRESPLSPAAQAWLELVRQATNDR